MPGGDKTGPQGYGPRTGRGLGYCSGNDHPGYATTPYGRGFGFFRRRGRGFGRGRGFWYHGPNLPVYPSQNPQETYPKPSKDEEKIYLQQSIQNLEQELNALRDRLAQLDKD